MAELVAVWNEDYCLKFKTDSKAKPRVLICWRQPWEKFIHAALNALNLDPAVSTPKLIFVENPTEAVEAVLAQFV